MGDCQRERIQREASLFLLLGASLKFTDNKRSWEDSSVKCLLCKHKALSLILESLGEIIRLRLFPGNPSAWGWGG